MRLLAIFLALRQLGTEDTYKRPTPKAETMPRRVLIGSLNCQIVERGSRKIKMSDIMLKGPLDSSSDTWFMQVPGILESHPLAIGLHWKMRVKLWAT